MKKLFFVFIIVVFGCKVFAQGNFEAGVILLKVRQPDIIRITQNQVINGSSQLQYVFNKDF
jgi:hypothetical protein